jgi:hypothetical protein
MKAILAATLIAVSSAFAEDQHIDIDVNVEPRSAGRATVETYTFLLRLYIKQMLKIADEHGDRTILTKNNPDIQEMASQLMTTYGFTRKQLDRECQIALEEYAEEQERERKQEANERKLEQLMQQLGL